MESTSHIATPAPAQVLDILRKEKNETPPPALPLSLSPVHTPTHTRARARTRQIDRRGESKPHLPRLPHARLRVLSTRSAAKGRRRRTPAGAHAAPGDDPGAGGRGPSVHDWLHRARGPSPKAASQGRLVFQSVILSFFLRSSGSGRNIFFFFFNCLRPNTQEKEKKGEKKVLSRRLYTREIRDSLWCFGSDIPQRSFRRAEKTRGLKWEVAEETEGSKDRGRVQEPGRKSQTPLALRLS